MGIFDFLFGPPNIEKLKANKDVEGLINALHYTFKDNDVRWRAAEALGKTGDERVVEPLINALKDTNKNVRQKAVEALGNIKDKRAVYPLIQSLKDENSDVREGAAESLGEIGDAGAVEPLIQSLKDENSSVRGAAAWALGNIGDDRVVEHPIQDLKDKNSDVREAAEEDIDEINKIDLFDLNECDISQDEIRRNRQKDRGDSNKCFYCKEKYKHFLTDKCWCSYCEKYFCSEHMLPEKHECSGEPKAPRAGYRKIYSGGKTTIISK